MFRLALHWQILIGMVVGIVDRRRVEHGSVGKDCIRRSRLTGWNRVDFDQRYGQPNRDQICCGTTRLVKNS